MAEVKILVNRPFEVRLDGKGEPLRFPCTILNGEPIPREYVIQETLLNHWYIKDLIKRGRIELVGEGSDLPPAENVAIEDMTKAQLVEAIRQIQPEFDAGRMTKSQLVEVLKEATASKVSTENETDGSPAPGAEGDQGGGGPDGSQENQE
jgi:hypothetical protein